MSEIHNNKLIPHGSREAHAEQDDDSTEKGAHQADAAVAGCVPASGPNMFTSQSPSLAVKVKPPGGVQQAGAAHDGGLSQGHQPRTQDSSASGKAAQPSDAAGAVRKPEDDMEKGYSPDDHAEEPVDFLGGFSLNSSFDPHMDVVLRFEFETSGQLKMRAFFVLSALAIAVAGFVILLLVRSIMPNNFFSRNKTLEIINVIASSVLLVITVVTMVAFTRRWFNCLRKGMRWSLRRKMMSRIYYIMGLVMVLQLALWLAPNAWSITRSYAWFGRFVAICGILRWSLINMIMIIFVVNGHNTNPWVGKQGALLGGRSASIVLDAPQWRTHWPKAILWLLFEVPYILQLAEVFSSHYEDREFVVKPLLDGACHRVTPFTAVATYSGGAFMLVYLVLYLWYLHKGFLLLRSRPYNAFRVGNILVRVQAARTILAFSVAILSCIVLWYSNPHKCASFFFAWQGLFPMQVVLAALVIADCTSFMPRNPNEKDDPILQVWLQQFAWTEGEKPGKLADRCEHMTNPDSAASLDEEPMFCMETALKALYWSTLVYRYDESAPDFTRDKPLKGRYTPEQGMGMLGLEQVQLFWERSLDTKVLIGWSPDTIVISVRGTASLRNAIADIQAWRVVHPPKRGRWWMASRPLVHRGFYMTWAANGLNKRVIAHVKSIIDASPVKAANMRILLTGHSLGGVVAILAAHDLATQLGLRNTQVYTFGAPRPGNRAFKEEYDELIPDTWNVINDADAVPRVGKFFILFSRPGKRVIVDYRGDVVVRPSPYEIFIRSGSNPGHHFLASYRRAFMGICQAQFTSKAQPGGRTAILELTKQPEMRDFLSACGLSPESLERMAFAAAFNERSGANGKDQKAVSQRESVWLDHLGSIHRVPLAFRHMFSAGGRRVGDRRSTDAAAPAAAVPESDVASAAAPDMTPGTAVAPGGPPSRGASLQRADKSALSTLVEQLSGQSQAEGEAADLQTEPSLAETPSLSQIRVSGGVTPLTSSPTRQPARQQDSMSPLMLSPRRKGMSAPPVAHDSVQIGRPSSADALREVHAEIMDKGVQLPPTGSRRASLSRHSSEMASRRSIAASPSKALAAEAAEDRPLTLAQTWARISRPPLAGRSTRGTPRGSAVMSPLGRPSAQPGKPGPPRAPLQAWSSLPSLARQLAAPSRKSLQLESASFVPGKQITPASPEWVPSPFSGSGFPGGLYEPPAQPPLMPAAGDSSPLRTPRASHRSDALQPASTAVAGSASFPAGSRGIVRHSSARAELLQRAAHTLSRRTANPEDLQSILQDLQKGSWQPEHAGNRPSTSASLAEEERACRHLSAQVENAVLPKMGSIVARASRLFSQASVALGIRVNPDDEMAEPLGDEDMEAAVTEAEGHRTNAEAMAEHVEVGSAQGGQQDD